MYVTYESLINEAANTEHIVKTIQWNLVITILDMTINMVNYNKSLVMECSIVMPC